MYNAGTDVLDGDPLGNLRVSLCVVFKFWWPQHTVYVVLIYTVILSIGLKKWVLVMIIVFNSHVDYCLSFRGSNGTLRCWGVLINFLPWFWCFKCNANTSTSAKKIWMKLFLEKKLGPASFLHYLSSHIWWTLHLDRYASKYRVVSRNNVSPQSYWGKSHLTYPALMSGWRLQ